ncbi:MAG TPA: hypothetical protein PLZ51_01680 [Aggregatilineales bacterium]|nr:hypothetical protein [Aggregatilineales bacterium]
MKTTLRFFTIGMLSLLVFGMATSTQPALACSGGSPTPLGELIDNAEIIVQGRIVELDDASVNAIFEVDTYFKGDGASHLVLSLYNPARVIQNFYRAIDDCNYPPTNLYIGVESLHFMTRRDNGSYVWSQRTLFDNDYYVVNDDVTYWVDDETPVEAPYDEFLTVIQDHVGIAPISPDATLPYPMLAPMLITTQSGLNYIFPIDKQAPMIISDDLLSLTQQFKPACWERNCTAWSSNGLHSAILDEAGMLIINPNLTNYRIAFEYPADAFSFSPSNNAIAIFSTTGRGVAMNIYLLHEYGLTLYQELFVTIDIDADAIMPNLALWSPDGRMIAYSDTQGAWLWDVFTEGSTPQLLTITDIPIHHFSPLGRYLTIGTDENGFSIDIISKQMLPAGVFSPNEQYLVGYGTHSETHQLSPFRPEIGDVVGASLVGAIPWEYRHYPITQIYWTDIRHYMVRICTPNYERACIIIPYEWNHYSSGFSSNLRHIGSAYHIALHPHLDQIAIVTDSRKVSFDMNQTEYDLSPYLDSPIASIEWLPSLFYYDA